MDNDQFAELSAWITQAGLAGHSESAILAGFCEREVARGLLLACAQAFGNDVAFHWPNSLPRVCGHRQPPE